jgi:phospholipid/cholesterol/gamma-HCH transport system substrate-binding protein
VPDIVAKTMAVICGALLVGISAVLYVTSRPAVGTGEVVAEFEDAFPILEGMFVRVDGAIAGSVGSVEVTEDGLARVTLVLDESIEEPSSDATAAIRQQDTTGDSYVAFEPGDSDKPLREVDGKPTIECGAESPTAPCKATLSAPRFDDLLNAFGPSERTGVKLVLLELSRALDQRGDDVNAAALELRPAMEAANEAFAEVQSQNAALRAVIEDAENVTSQAASKRTELAELIDGLETTLVATASESDGLDAGLERLPETIVQARTTMGALANAAEAGLPLARDVEARAPELAAVIDAAPGFLDDTEAVLDRSAPTIELTRRLLRSGAPTIKADPSRVVTGPFDLAPAASNLLTGVLGDDNTIKALFGDDSGGVGPGTLDRAGLGAVAVEPGNQPGYPADHENRNFVRISAVLNCTMFGVPVEPGCLTSVLGPRRRDAGLSGGSAAARNREGEREARQSPGAEASPPEVPGLPLDPRDPLGVDLDDLVGDPPLAVPETGLGSPEPRRSGRPGARATRDILDFLFKP